VVTMTETAQRPRSTRRQASTSAAQTKKLTPQERVAFGKVARTKTPLEAHAEFSAAKTRDPVGLLLTQAKTRVPDLVPIRYGRMLVSPFAFTGALR
jgi:hypothetical protein